MKYSYPDNIRLSVEPQEFNRNSSKEILQYAVGGLLYMPATKNIADVILNKTHPEYKSICLDLEDAIGDDTVTQAEECLKSNLTRIKMLLTRIPSASMIFLLSSSEFVHQTISNTSLMYVEQTCSLLSQDSTFRNSTRPTVTHT